MSGGLLLYLLVTVSTIWAYYQTQAWYDRQLLYFMCRINQMYLLLKF